MSKFTLEVCADSVESVLAAEKGGADRIELCGNVVIGGTTPSESLFREIRRYSDIKIHALIRPRFGDFCYTEYEFDIIRSEVRRFRELGAQGVVIGMLISPKKRAFIASNNGSNNAPDPQPEEDDEED